MKPPVCGEYFAMLVDGRRRVVQSRGVGVGREIVILAPRHTVPFADVLELTTNERAALGLKEES